MYIDDKDSALAYPRLTRTIMLITGIALGFIISGFFIMPFFATDNSMLPNIKIGNLVFILKHVSPEIGDIVLIKSPADAEGVYLKRLIAKEGDAIEIRNKVIYINNKRFRFKWKTQSIDERIFPMNFTYRDNTPSVKIKKNNFYVIGDNLDRSYDSRNFGVIPYERIIGKVIYQ